MASDIAWSSQMQYRHRLRSRIVVSFLVLGTMLSGLFALSTLFLQNYLEDRLIGETLAREVDAYVDQLKSDPTSTEPFYTRIQGYVTRPEDPDRVDSLAIAMCRRLVRRRV